MIPVLYEENETEYLSNGLGRLTDAISCTVHQERNGIYELSMRYPHEGIHAAEITANRIIYAEPEFGKGPQPFIIRDVDKTLAEIQITARHRSYDASYYAVAEFGQTKVVPYQVTPVLYDHDLEVIGTLDDLGQYQVAETGSTWTLTMIYPASGRYAHQITTSTYIYAQPAIGRDLHLFDITEIGEGEWDGAAALEITEIGEGEGDGAAALEITATCPVTPDVPREYNQMTVAQALSYISDYAAQIQTLPFTFSTEPKSAGDEWATQLLKFWNEAPTSLRELLGEDSGSLSNVFGGEWEYDDFRMILHEERGHDNGVQYRYGKNITDISERINIDDLYTHAFAYWKGTASSSTNTEQGQYYVKRGTIIKALDDQYDQMFPTPRMMIIDASSDFEQEPTTEELDAYTTKYIKDNKVGVPTVTINVSVVDLASTEEYEDIVSLETVNLCDTVTVVFPRFNVDIKAKVTAIEYDVLLGKNNFVTIGQTDVKLSDLIAQDQHNLVRQKYDLQKWADRCSERAIEALSGWYGGNIRKNFDVNDHKQQSMYVMNTDNVNTATRAIKLDGNGIGISRNGAQGDYAYMVNLAYGNCFFTDRWANDGDTNASFLKRGVVRAGNSYMNIENGQSYMDLVGLVVNGRDVLGAIDSLSGNTSAAVQALNKAIDSLSENTSASVQALNNAITNLTQRVNALEKAVFGG